MDSLDLPTTPCAPAERQNRIRIAAVLGCAVLLLGMVCFTFWYQDLRYSLPTLRPPGLTDVSLGASVLLPASLPPPAAGDHRPLWFHFFNPECPCTRFNAEHIRSLRARFGPQVRLVAVAQADAAAPAAQHRADVAAAIRLFGPGIEILTDDDGAVAKACGVYSTPQAVILTADSSHALLFRGNYNAARYCADPQTEFVRFALSALVNHQPLPAESRAAMVAYGCELPANVAATRAAVPSRSKL